jgi:lysozyme
MGLFGWLRAFWQRDAIPPASADMLGAATLVKEKAPNLSQESMPHVVMDTRGGPVPEAAVVLVKKWEGFRAKPYRCPAGVPTIGYGATFYADGESVRMDDEPITEDAASGLLRTTMARFATDVDRAVKVPLNAGERGALISFTFNLGPGALRQSTLLKKLNAGDRAGAANEFQRWNRAGSSILEGLTRRRAEEAAMFRGGSE